VADFDNDGDLDIFSGGGPLTQGERVWFLWENADGRAARWTEHVVQRGLETHESVCADVDQDGDVDILTKPWRGDVHVFVENLLKSKQRIVRSVGSRTATRTLEASGSLHPGTHYGNSKPWY
jgi:hypothetical protein